MLAMSLLPPIEPADSEVRPGIDRAAEGARASGTPFISFFTPTEMLALAREGGFRDARHVSSAALAERYFAGRTDGLCPPNNSEELPVATNQRRDEHRAEKVNPFYPELVASCLMVRPVVRSEDRAIVLS